MSLGFWGGFAGGLSDSIEKNRDRAKKQKKIDDDREIAQKEILAKENEKRYELANSTREAFEEVNSKIEEIRSGDVEMSDIEKIGSVNYLQSQKLEIYKKAMDYGSTIGIKSQDELIDLSKEEIGSYGIVSENGEKYVLDNELATTIRDSNGQLERRGNEVFNQVMKRDANGIFKPVKNADGTYEYESTGVSLKKFSDVYRTKKDTSGSSNEERYITDWLNVNMPDDATDEQVSSGRMRAAKEYRNMIKPNSVKEMETKNSAVRFGNSFIESKYATDLATVNWDIVSKDDKRKLSEHADIGIRMVMGTKAPELMGEVKAIEQQANKLSSAANNIKKQIDNGEDANVIKQSIAQYFSAFFGYSEEEAERISTNKEIVTMFNEQRHDLFGSVLTKGENTNYTNQASSLFRNNQDMFIAVKQMLNRKVDSLEQIESKIGKDLFKMKFGNVLDDAKTKVSLLKKAETKKVTSLDRAKSRRDKKKIDSDPIYKRFKEKYGHKGKAYVDRAYKTYQESL